VVVLATAAVFGGSFGSARASTSNTDSARWSASKAHNVVMSAVWPDERIVVGATCVGLDLAPSGTAHLASWFACQLEIWTRPARVPETNWRVMADAFRRHDITRIYALLGVAAGASKAQVDAAARAWGLGTARPLAIGVRVLSGGRWQVTASPIAAANFTPAIQARAQVLYAIPAIEVYYVEHHAYTGVTAAKLQQIDSHVSGVLRIATATASRYCVENTAGSTTWSEQGPDGAVHFGACA
jgi:hypothetical protein